MTISLKKTKSGHEYKTDGHRFTVRKPKGTDEWEVKHWGDNIFLGHHVTDQGRVVGVYDTLGACRQFIARMIA